MTTSVSSHTTHMLFAPLPAGSTRWLPIIPGQLSHQPPHECYETHPFWPLLHFLLQQGLGYLMWQQVHSDCLPDDQSSTLLSMWTVGYYCVWHWALLSELVVLYDVNTTSHSQCNIHDTTPMWNKHRDITDHLPAVHAVSGCDTTSYLYGIRKATMLKVLV